MQSSGLGRGSNFHHPENFLKAVFTCRENSDSDEFDDEDDVSLSVLKLSTEVFHWTIAKWRIIGNLW